MATYDSLTHNIAGCTVCNHEYVIRPSQAIEAARRGSRWQGLCNTCHAFTVHELIATVGGAAAEQARQINTPRTA